MKQSNQRLQSTVDERTHKKTFNKNFYTAKSKDHKYEVVKGQASWKHKQYWYAHGLNEVSVKPELKSLFPREVTSQQ